MLKIRFTQWYKSVTLNFMLTVEMLMKLIKNYIIYSYECLRYAILKLFL